MKPSRVLKVLPQLLTNRWPAFVWGPPGVGKSSVVKQVAEGLKLPLLDVRASLLDPTDLRGIPSVFDGRAVWAPPSFLPTPKQPAGILFFDELNAAPPLVQASLLQLTLDHRVGEYILPPGWRIVAAGNRAEDRTVTFRMPSALANRFIHLDFEADFEDWKAWAYRNAVHPLVVAFLSTRRELLFKRAKDDRAFPTPRSWEMASDVIRTLGPGKASMDVLAGVVGELVVVGHRQRPGRARLDAQPAEDAPQVVDLIDGAVPLTGGVLVLGGVVRALDEDRVRGARPGAQLAADALLQAVGPAVELVPPVEARHRDLLLALLGVTLGEGLAEDRVERDAEPGPLICERGHQASVLSASRWASTTSASSDSFCPGIGGTG